MSSYLRQTNYEPLRVPLYQPDFGMISRVSLMQQSRYDRGVQSIANTYNESLGLSQNLSPYNQQKLNGYMDNATQQLKKMSTLDFSKANNIAQATNLFSPIYQDKDLMFEHQAHGFGDQQQQSAISMRDSKDKDQRDGYSDINMKYVMAPMAKLRNATTREEMLKNSEEVLNRPYTPYYDIVGNFNKQAKDLGLDYSVAYSNGAYIVTNKFGEPAYPSMREFAQMNLGEKGVRQLQINSTVAIEDMQRDMESRGLPVTNEAIAGNIMHSYANNLSDNIQDQQKVLNALQGKYNMLDKMVKQGTLKGDDDPNSKYGEYLQLGEQIKAANEGLTNSQEEYKKYTDPSNDEYKKMYGDYVANPIDGAFKIAYSNLIDGWAKSYADGHVDRAMKMDDVWNTNQQIMLEKWKEVFKEANSKDKDKETKDKPLTLEQQKQVEADKLNYSGQGANFDYSQVIPGSYLKAFKDGEELHRKNIREASYTMMDYMSQKNWGLARPGPDNPDGIRHTWLVDQVTKGVGKAGKDPKAIISSEMQQELSTSPMFKGVDLSKMSYWDLYSRMINDSTQFAQSGIDMSDPQFNPIAHAKNAMAIEQIGLDNMEKMRKDPNSLVNQAEKYSDFVAPDGSTSDKSSYIKKRLKESGYIMRDEPLSAVSGVTIGRNTGRQSIGVHTYKNGELVDYPDDLSNKFGNEYDQQLVGYNNAEKSLRADPNMRRILFDENYPITTLYPDKTVPRDRGRDIFGQIYSQENLTAGLIDIKNLGVLSDASGISPKDLQPILMKLQTGKDELERVDVVNYAPDGKTPYTFKWKSDDLVKLLGSGAMNKYTGATKDLQGVVDAVAKYGVTIGYAGKTSVDAMRENTMERHLDLNGKFSFKADSQGKFGYDIENVNIPGKGPSTQATIHYLSKIDPNTGRYYIGADGNPEYRPTTSAPYDLGAVTADEGANSAIDAVMEFIKQYQTELTQGTAQSR